MKAELTALSGQIEQLRNELVRTGAAGGLPAEAATGLTRLDQLEAELRRLTDRVDVLTNDVIRITEDASNRVGDIEFRLTELEGGDISVRPEPSLLGGGVTRPMPRPVSPAVVEPGTGTLAVTEQSDFDAAVAAADAGDNAKAAELFATFLADLPRRAALDRGAVPPRRRAGGAGRTGARRRGAISTPSAARRRTRARRMRSTSWR